MTQNMTAYYAIKAMAHYEKETLIARLSYILTENQLNRLTNGIATKIELVDPVKFAEYMEEVGIFDATFCGGTFITSISDTNDSPILANQSVPLNLPYLTKHYSCKSVHPL